MVSDKWRKYVICPLLDGAADDIGGLFIVYGKLYEKVECGKIRDELIPQRD
jgi:hypothetical protein